ncbi:MAG: hypothetical protein QWI73_07190 [Alphaproteobacteria bacterium]|nr:hypothetical protein [Alphaproteobacteria bacterium]
MGNWVNSAQAISVIKVGALFHSFVTKTRTQWKEYYLVDCFYYLDSGNRKRRRENGDILGKVREGIVCFVVFFLFVFILLLSFFEVTSVQQNKSKDDDEGYGNGEGDWEGDEMVAGCSEGEGRKVIA